MNWYEHKQQMRRDRLEARADRLRKEAAGRFAAAHAEIEHIPPGQPILVGHHSEKRHRAALRRHYQRRRKGIELSKAAAEAAGAAASVGTAGISSDDPEAVRKIKEEIAELEARQIFMAGANKIARAFYKAGVRNQESGPLWDKYLAKLRELRPDLDGQSAATMLKPDFFNIVGFAPFELSNNGANIRRLKARLEQLAAVAAADDVELEINGVRILARPKENRVRLVFAGKPPAVIRDELKSFGFRWAPSEGAWQRHYSGSAWHWAKAIAGKMEVK